MTVTITWPMIFAAVVGIPSVSAIIIRIFQTYAKGYDWVKHQREQDEQIKLLEQKHDAQVKIMNGELKALTSAMLACLQCVWEVCSAAKGLL